VLLQMVLMLQVVLMMLMLLVGQAGTSARVPARLLTPQFQ
jgi:hypothetical protein